MHRVIVTLISALTCACAAAQGLESRPAWIDQPLTHPACDRGQSLCGIGSAKGTDPVARDLARRRALEDIAATIAVEVASIVEVQTTSHRENDEIFWTDTLAEQIRLSASAELPGAEVVDRWTDAHRSEVHVLVAVSRELMLDTCLPGVRQAGSDATAFLLESRSIEEDDPGRALRHALSAYEALAGSLPAAFKARVVADGSRFARAVQDQVLRIQALISEASGRVADLASRLRISKLAGDEQSGFVHGTLADALRVRIEYLAPGKAPVPVAGFPVVFDTVVPARAVLSMSATTTDTRGEVACRVTDLAGTGRASNEIRVRPDLHRLAPTFPQESIPSERFLYSLPTPGQVAIAVAIVEHLEQGPRADAALGETVADHLSSHGFDARSTNRPTPSDSTGVTRSTESEGFDFLIRGEAFAHVSSRDAGLVWFRARAELEIVEVHSGRVRALVVDDVRSAHRDDSVAGAFRAMGALGRAVRDELDRVFVADYLPPKPPVE